MIELIRNNKSKAGQAGTIFLEDFEFPSLEQPDLGNLPYRSCVPLGEYVLIPFDSPKYGDTFIMVNPDLNVYRFEHSHGRPEDGRFLCLFVHRGNYVRNFQGCVGAGKAYLEDQDMITATKTTCRKVNQLVNQEGSYRLNITHEVE